MPIKGVLLILLVTAIGAVIYKDDIYDWLEQFSLDEDDTDFKEEDE